MKFKYPFERERKRERESRLSGLHYPPMRREPIAHDSNLVGTRSTRGLAHAALSIIRAVIGTGQ